MPQETVKHRDRLPRKQWDFRNVVGVGIAPSPLVFSLMNLGLVEPPMQQFPIVFAKYFQENVVFV